MKPERQTRYVKFPRSKVYHKLGKGIQTLCGLSSLGVHGQYRLGVKFSFARFPDYTYCINCHQNE